MRAAGMTAVHATVAYHENFRQLADNLIDWQRRFRRHRRLIFHAATAADLDRAAADQRTAIFLGTQTPAPLEADIGLVQILHTLGIRFIQLTYNNQSLLAGGCGEEHDSGLTRFGKQIIAEMNRVGIVIDLSHAGERSLHQAIDASTRPIAVTHANPRDWHDCPRNLSPAAIAALVQSGGMLGLSLYPHHLRGGSECTLAQFCQMAAQTARRYGAHAIGIGSDLCQDQPDSVVQWMRDGRWRDPATAAPATFPPPLPWFKSNRDFPTIAQGLRQAGLTQPETDAVMGGNWHRFLHQALPPADPDTP